MWEWNVGHWWFGIYFHPRSWGLCFHHHKQCCKWWLLVGPFDINRTWTEDETLELGA